MSRRVFEATRSDGTIVTRSSNTKVYTHCVAIWRDATPGGQDRFGVKFPDAKGGWVREVEWASRCDLAEKNAARWNKHTHYHAEVLDVREVTDLVLKPAARWAQQREAAKDAADTANADRIDGYDRDDLGESPDY